MAQRRFVGIIVQRYDAERVHVLGWPGAVIGQRPHVVGAEHGEVRGG